MLPSDMLTSSKRARNIEFLGCFAKCRKAAITFNTSDSPSAWDNSTSTGKILVKIYTSGFFSKSAPKKISNYFKICQE